MSSDINPKIIELINNSSKPTNIKECLFEIMEMEYEKMDVDKPKLKDKYIKLINKYK